MNRREFITGAAATALAAGCATKPAATHDPKVARAAGPAQFHVFSKEFQSPVTSSPEALCDLLAAAGYDGIQWTVRGNGHVKPENAKADLPRYVKIAASRGLKCASICTNITSDAAGRPGLSEGAEELLRVAADCGITMYRPGYYFYDVKNETFAQSRARFHRGFANLAALGARTGVKATYQNHSSWDETVFGGAIWDLYDCLRDLDPRDVGLEYDPMHALFETNNSWTHGFDLVMPWIAAVDLKDSYFVLDPENPKKTRRQTVAAGGGVVPWAQVRAHLDAAGARPLFNLHFEHAFDKTNLAKSVGDELAFFRKVFA
jgi:L-ribulose-5-phosphate 3-epimerase